MVFFSNIDGYNYMITNNTNLSEVFLEKAFTEHSSYLRKLSNEVSTSVSYGGYNILIMKKSSCVLEVMCAHKLLEEISHSVV